MRGGLLIKAAAGIVALGAAALWLASARHAAQTAHRREKIEVLHFWTSGGEAAAIRVIMQAVEKQGVTWIDEPATGTDNLNQVLHSRAASGTPPGASHLHSAEVGPWARDGYLTDLSDVAAADHWDSVIAPSIIPKIKIDGRYYAVPVDVHRTNWLWYNKKTFDRLGLTPPRTLEELKGVAEKLRAAGVIPLATGGSTWEEGALFESVVVAVGGPEFYRKAMVEQDEAALHSILMIKAFDEFRNLNKYIDPNYPGRDWNIATQMVINGQAGMQIIGDYAKSELVLDGAKPNVDYGCVPAPGNAGSFLQTTDIFSMFKTTDEAETKAQKIFAKVVMDKGVQLEFSQKKGSLPARADVDVGALDYCGRKGFEDRAEAEKQGHVLPAVSHMEGTGPERAGVFLDVISSFFENPAMTSQQAVDSLISGLKSVEE